MRSAYPTLREEREGWERIPREAQMLLPAVAAWGTRRLPRFPVRSTGQDHVCAFLFKERRMQCRELTRLHRKSGLVERIESVCENSVLEGHAFSRAVTSLRAFGLLDGV